MMRLLAAGLAVVLAVPACTHHNRTPDLPSASPVPPPPELELADLFAPQRAVPTGQRGGVVRIAVPAEAQVLDPFAPGGDTPAARDLAPLWLPGLYHREAGGRRSPWLASAPPTVTADGRRVVVPLRSDALWSDGSAITSADVAATWRYATGRPGPWRTAYAVLAGVETPNPTTAVLVLKTPGLTWAGLFDAPTGVLPAAWVTSRQRSAAFDLSVTGGPFVRGVVSAGLQTEWRRTPRPWPGSDPLLDGVTTVTVPDFSTALALLHAGQLDALAPYQATDAERRVRAEAPTVRVDANPSTITVLTFATDHGPLADARVRQAIAVALDRSVFAARLLRSGGALADDLVPPGRPGYRASFSRWRPDLDRARQLLTAAGWTDRGERPRLRKGAELTLVLAAPSPDDLGDAVIRGLQVQLHRVGIQLDLAAAEAATVEELARTGQADLAVTHWDTEPIADVGRLLASSGSAPQGAGWSRWHDATADRLFAAISGTDDLAEYDRRLAAALDRVAVEVPVLPLYAVHPVLGGRNVDLAGPVAGQGGPFALVERWTRNG